MRKEFIIRKVRTASQATAVQIICYEESKRIIVQHIGSAHTEAELTALYHQAELVREKLCKQLSLFPVEKSLPTLVDIDHLQLNAVTHRFAYEALKRCAQLCGLGELPSLYQDLALMRIIQPTSKLRTLELLSRYFNISYAEHTVYRILPLLMNHKEAIEHAAYQTACAHFGESFALVLYDVTGEYAAS